MTGGSLVVLSPHLDDAVLSAWSALRGHAEVSVVNVCTGLPEEGTLAPWDALTGARDSRRRMQERIEEDRAALALAGVEPVALGFLDEQYRDRPLDQAALNAAVADAVAGATEIWVPAGIGGHADHVQVRAAAQALGVPLQLYADLPYAVKFGWPAWVTGEAADPYLDVDEHWRRWLPDGAEPTVHRLVPAEAELKLAAMRLYATQVSALVGGAARLADPLVLAYEVSWGVAGAERDDRAAAGASATVAASDL